jgi:predicted Zn-dependent peptidase
MHLADHLPETPFETVPNDPMQVHECTLSNGLKLFFSVNKDEPRVATEIAVRAGSKHDPASSTGLAHYFEHMMFKGTDRIGTLDWEAEKMLLDKIEDLYEQHRNTTDLNEKRTLYLQIDDLSAQAAKYATANEYDKLLGAMGAKGTNAYTWVEQTVYLNDIPTNELERWFKVESERFRRPVLRLFHTELETVFEEFNISQDKDFRKVSKVMMETLMPTHPYGTQTTLGKGEDLKNPSQKAIYQFFEEHYVPNNLAITLCGDFDIQEARQLAEKYFGSYVAKPIPPFSFKPQPELKGRQERIVYGEENEWIELAWRLPGAGHKDQPALTLLSMILYNEVAGLIDSELVQSQKLLTAYAYVRVHEDYSMLILYGKPREGQSLQEVEELLLDQIKRVHHGDFEEWLMQGAAKMFQVEELKRLRSNSHRAHAITTMFVLGRPWSEMVAYLKKLSKLKKEDVVQAAKKWAGLDNYVAVKKLYGTDPNVLKVEKPPITPVEVNRDGVSDFARDIFNDNTPPLMPEWPDFNHRMRSLNLRKGVKLFAVTDTLEQLGTIEWIWPVGKLYKSTLSLLQSYLNYLGTDKYSSTEVRRELFRLGVQMEVKVSDNHTVIRVNGLDKSLPDAAQLMHHFLHHVQPDTAALENLVADVLTSRTNHKKNKDHILRSGLKPFAMHGKAAIERFVIPENQLRSIKATDLIDLLKEMMCFAHEVHYHGPRTAAKVKRMLSAFAADQQALVAKPEIKPLKELPTTTNKVFFVHFPMVQVEILQVSKGSPKFKLEEYLIERWFNNYFGTSMSSVVFQEIREARAMAYQTYAMALSPTYKNLAHYFFTFVGTQPDKMAEAISVMNDLVEDMPLNAELVEQARINTTKVLQANRLPLSNTYWRYHAIKNQGWKDEPLKQVLAFNENADHQALIDYHEKYIKGRKSTWLILGDRKMIDKAVLRKLGKLTELSVEDVLGY